MISERMSLDELVDASADALKAGNAELGKALALQAIQRQEDCTEAWTNMSWAELLLGDPQAAADATQRAIGIEPFNAVAWHNLGEAHASVQSWEQALGCYNRALTIDSDLARSWAGRGTALLGLDRFAEAVACFDKALGIDPQLEGPADSKQLALAQADPARRELLLIAFGIAAARTVGELDDDLETTVLRAFGGNPAIDDDLIRTFDNVAGVLAKRQPRAEVIPFCEVNMVLARLLGDPALMAACQSRLADAIASGPAA